ncbi:hypothetical protein L9F63_012878 [Diploptera punctata]|uniref:Cytochrome P450 n=1 Tax=Diploptera punctata TaxID=6984 RepID=A0AAD8EMT7_DIPPU|nr:hypothetical protein L9F63_012878 [Diploptera punctata]
MQCRQCLKRCPNWTWVFPIWKVFSTRVWRDFVKVADYFGEVSNKYINQAMERMKTMEPDSGRELTVLEKFLAADPDPRTAMVMATDMMAAGIDTTSYTAAILMYFLAKNQDVQEKLFNEVVRFLPAKGDPITSASINEMKYLKACLKESMRMQPVTIGNIRKLTKDMVLSNYRVPKGVTVIIPGILISNMDKYFPEANKFLPERWIKGLQPEVKHHPFVSLPFGFGPRMCVGRRFAELEIETLVAKIVRNFHIEYNYEDMKFKNILLIVPASPLKFKFTEREI